MLGACGGGDGSPSTESTGTREFRTITSRFTGTTYSIDIFRPPASAGKLGERPIVYALDGETWFDALVNANAATSMNAIIVAVQTAGQRNRDYVPVNACTPGGGGEAAYFAFIREELAPFIEGTIGGDPARRALFGHSHGASFVFYAMFAETPGAETFKAYLPSDASLQCMPSLAYEWEQNYAANYSALPVRLYVSSASQGNAAVNVDYAQAITQRNYQALVFQSLVYPGSHTGIVANVLPDALRFAFSSP